MIKFNCPNCNQTLVIRKENREFAFCEYCGQKLMLEKYRGAADLPEPVQQDTLDSWTEKKRKELAIVQKSIRREKYIKLWVIAIIVTVAMAFAFVLTSGIKVGAYVLMYAGGLVVAAGAFMLFKWLPDLENERALLYGEKVRFPKYLEPIEGKNYKTVENELYNAGFLNITCISLHDIKIGISKKTNKVESVTVNDKMVYIGGKIYPPDAKVVIRYHGK